MGGSNSIRTFENESKQNKNRILLKKQWPTKNLPQSNFNVNANEYDVNRYREPSANESFGDPHYTRHKACYYEENYGYRGNLHGGQCSVEVENVAASQNILRQGPESSHYNNRPLIPVEHYLTPESRLTSESNDYKIASYTEKYHATQKWNSLNTVHAETKFGNQYSANTSTNKASNDLTWRVENSLIDNDQKFLARYNSINSFDGQEKHTSLKHKSLVDSHDYGGEWDGNSEGGFTEDQTTRYRSPLFTHHHQPQFKFNPSNDLNSEAQLLNEHVSRNSSSNSVRGSCLKNTAPHISLFDMKTQSVNDFHGLGRSSEDNSSDDDDYEVEPWTITSYDDHCLDNERFPRSVSEDTSYIGPHVKRKQSGVEYPLTDERNYSEYLYNDDNESDSTSDDVETSGQRDERSDVLSILSFPSKWSSCAKDKTSYVDISFDTAEGMSLKKFFGRTSQSKEFQLKIVGITRIENPFMHSFYLLKKEEMENRNGHVDELFLYHGTKNEHLQNICEQNLNWRMISENHRFGKGVSFSPTATYSSHYSDKTLMKVMLLFKVLVSNAVIGLPDLTVPPVEGGITYDTSVKDDTSVIVKYCDNEYYPLYKIVYTKQSVI